MTPNHIEGLVERIIAAERLRSPSGSLAGGVTGDRTRLETRTVTYCDGAGALPGGPGSALLADSARLPDSAPPRTVR